MFSSSRTSFVSLLAFFSLLLASVDASSPLLQQRDHTNLHMKRVLRKRVPLPQESGPVVGAAPLPDISLRPHSTATPPTPTDTSVSVSLPATSTTSTKPDKATTTSSAPLSTSSPAISSGRSASSSVSARTSASDAQTVSTTDDSVGVSTIIGPNRTRTASVQSTQSVVPDQQGNTSSSQIKSTTMTVIIAIAASVGGVFILWTIFRKWKLSRSKGFDRRLNPIDWQPTTGDDEEQFPGQNRPRPTSPTSSSVAHGRNSPSSQGHSNPFDDFDSPVQSSAPVGGYADLARGANSTQMQERLQSGPSYSQGATPVPLHHGGY